LGDQGFMGMPESVVARTSSGALAHNQAMVVEAAALSAIRASSDRTLIQYYEALSTTHPSITPVAYRTQAASAFGELA
jgi:hypothetical protein